MTQSVTLNNSVQTELQSAVSRYRKSLPGSPAEEYLENRGIPEELAEPFRLGFVEDPIPGHERYRGRLAIPYLRRGWRGWSVIDLRFRAIDDSHPKYLGLPAAKPHLFNTLDVLESEREIMITEGEIDALTASAYGIPAVGVPGATNWNEGWREIFEGYETVWVPIDGDKPQYRESCSKCGKGRPCRGHMPGLEFGEAIAKSLGSSVKFLMMPEGEDINSMVVKQGIDSIRRMMQ